MSKLVRMIFKLTILLCFTFCSLYAAEQQCTTPNGETGNCISIYKCSELYDALATFNDTQIKFVQKSQCGYDKTPLVCCPVRNLDAVTTQKGQDILRNRKYCGYQRVDDYLTEKNRKKANIDEFPWLASLLFLIGPNKTENQCSGVLISDRYVLTAAHCIITRDYNLVGVRLGEYNTKLEKDCADNSEIEDCGDPVEEYGIEKALVHAEYSIRNKTNDIGLLRLNKTVTFSDFIRPICLPFPGTKLALNGENMTVSGWGKASNTGKPVHIKKRVLVELSPLEECNRFYTKRHRNITNRQLCTKAKAYTQDLTCHGDSGGPVMFPNKDQWHVEGIVSFGVGCGIVYPEVNTNVVSYLDWIVENIKS